MSKKNKKYTIDFSYGDHAEKPDTIVLSFTGTGLKATNPEHKSFIEALCRVIGSQMLAKSMGLKPEDVEY